MTNFAPSDPIANQPGLRRAVGYVALILPFVLGLGHLFHSNTFMQPTLSHFYYVPVLGDIMVGSLCAVGGFLIYYQGYEKTDSRLTTAAGVSVIGVALIATDNNPGLFAQGYTRAIVDLQGTGPTSISYTDILFELNDWMPFLHVLCALIFFACLAWISFFEFTKSAQGGEMTAEKRQRNRVYRTTGWIIVVMMLLILARMQLFKSWAPWDNYAITFILEAIAILAFGISWLIKGEALMRDR